MHGVRWKRLSIVGLTVACITYGGSVAGASSANISRSFHAAGSIPNGSLVSIDPSRADYVQPANTSNGARLVGVAVSSNDSLLAVNPSNGMVQVATSGTATALASTVNGNIGVGDSIAVSPFEGIGMHALAGSHIIGLAQTTLTATTPGSTQQTVKDAGGKSATIHVGYIQLSIAVGTTATTPNTLSDLQKIVKQLTGHDVPVVRIIVSLAIIIVALVALIALVYGAIYGSIISIGRNPLAKHTVLQSLTGVITMAGLIALVTVAVVYFLLQ